MITPALSPPSGATWLLDRRDISSRDVWGATGVSLKQGSRYFFRASGTWWDAWISCDANGYNRAYMNRFKDGLRCKLEGATWFTLIGSIGQSDRVLFVIGDGSRVQEGWVAPEDGPLCAFANDKQRWYWNNLSFITLEVWQ